MPRMPVPCPARQGRPVLRRNVLLRNVIVVSLALAVCCTTTSSAGVVYVSPGGSDSNTGRGGWGQAKATVQAGVDAAGAGDEVWVSAGAYTQCVTLKGGVALYGGFLGTETQREQRDLVHNVTTLDGGQAGPVVTIPAGATMATVVDGFTLRNGKSVAGAGIDCGASSAIIANNVITENLGGGVYCGAGSPRMLGNRIHHNSSDTRGGAIRIDGGSPIITGNTIQFNSVTASGGFGGAIYCGPSSSPSIRDNVISDNACAGSGGGIACSGSSASVLFNWIERNSAAVGGGVCVSGSAVTQVSHNQIKANIAAELGAGIACVNGCTGALFANTLTGNSAPTGSGGAIGCSEGSSPAVKCNLAYANSAGTGGAIYCEDSSPTTLNNTFAHNTQDHGGAVHCVNSPAELTNNIIAFNSAGVAAHGASAPLLRNNCVCSNGESDYSGLAAGEGDIASDPGFADAPSGGYHITPFSPCANAGWQAANLPSEDFETDARMVGRVDIGADECALSVSSIRDARLVASDYPAELRGVVVSAAFDGFFYVEDENRTCGIRVDLQNHGLSAGSRVDLAGQSVGGDGERRIRARSVTQVGSGNVQSLGISNAALGGGDWNYVSSTGAGQRGVANGVGLNNIGLLVQVWGKVVSRGPGEDFTIDDGSGQPVWCRAPAGFAMDTGWDYVSVTGVSSCENVIGSGLVRIVRVRTADDVTQMR